jgi:hypothetical protein
LSRKPVIQPEMAISGWLLQVRWPLVVVLSLILPVGRAIANQWRTMREKAAKSATD